MKNAPVWDLDLIKRYNQSGPRYTSYPTAVQFNEQFEVGKYHSSAWRSSATTKPLSLYFHIPFCSHVCYYCACNKIVTKHRSRSDEYLEYLFREIEMQADLYSSDQPVEQLHFGGGTPTFLSPEQMQALMGKIRDHFNLLDNDQTDYSIELDPRDVDWPMMSVLRDLGFNRISIGVQDLDERVQIAVNRVQPERMVRSVLDAARAMTFKSIHMDLIYGLPFQNADSFMDTVDRVIDMAPDRLSLFNYAHLPHRFKAQRRIKDEDLPSPEVKLDILQKTTDKLMSQGYVYIGMDHFALPDDELAVAQEEGVLHRNFQGYTTHGHCDLVSMGVSSISQVGDVYVQNTTDEPTYRKMISKGNLPVARGLRMEADDKIRQAVIARLICQFTLAPGEIEDQFQINFAEYFAEELNSLSGMIQDELLTIDDAHRIKVLPKGKLLIRNICMKFDAYMKTPADKPLYSKVI